MQAQYVIGPNIIAYIIIDSEPELFRGPPGAAAFAEGHLIKDVADEARKHSGRASVDLSRGADIGCDPL